MAIIVRQQDVAANENYGRTINHTIELFINRELAQRGQKQFKVAQIELSPNSGVPPIVKLDKEVQFFAEFHEETLTPDMIGSTVTTELSKLKNVTYDPNSFSKNTGKIFLLRWNENFWIIDFNFEYYSEYLHDCTERLQQFIRSIELLSDESNVEGVLVFLMFSACELLTDALYCKAHRDQTPANHKERLSCNQGDSDFQNLHRFLYDNYQKARYAREEMSKFPAGQSSRNYIKTAIATLKTNVGYLEQ